MIFAFFLLIPFIMIAGGIFMYKFTPKKANGFIGYRTRRSCLNSDTWQFANRYCGKLWIVLGIIMLVLSGIVIGLSAIKEKEINDMVGMIAEALEMAVLLGSIVPVEISLKHNFDKSGNRRKIVS